MPVDFEEVHVTSNADEEDIRNAIMAIRRNRVALKGERGVFLAGEDTCAWGVDGSLWGPVRAEILRAQWH